MSQAYYRKWRPQGWDEIVGQDHVVRTIRNALHNGNITHAYLFSGPRGTGKTTTARIIAKAVNCQAEDLHSRPCNSCDHCEDINLGRFMDLIEIDAASNTSVDDVRDLREKINYSPSKGRYKVYIIDEVHMLSNAAFNALLKTLEEPPAHAIFILATTEVYKIPATVISRCQRHEFRRIPVNIIQAILKEIAEKEGVQIEAAALTVIARQATGSLRDAVSLLDQLASTGEAITLEIAQNVLGTATSESVIHLVEALLSKDAGKCITTIQHALDSGSDPRQYNRQIIDLLRELLLVKLGNLNQLELTPEETSRMKTWAHQFEQEWLVEAINIFNHATQSTSLGWQPSLQLELAVTRLITSDQPGSHTENSEKVEIPSLGEKKLSKGPQRDGKAKKNDGKQEEAPPADLTPSFDQKKVTDRLSDESGESTHQASPSSDAGESADDNSEIQLGDESWKAIKTAAKELSPETSALLNSCRSVSMKNGKMVLGFSSDLLSSKMENGTNLDFARKAIQKVMGMDVLIECTVAGKHANRIPEGRKIDHDGVVGTALSLGGEITEEN
jgi:DNA polymerase-3 subunit gamma/tau